MGSLILVALLMVSVASATPTANRFKRDLPIDWNITTPPAGAETVAPAEPIVTTETEVVVVTTEVVVVPEVVVTTEVQEDVVQTTTPCEDEEEVVTTSAPVVTTADDSEVVVTTTGPEVPAEPTTGAPEAPTSTPVVTTAVPEPDVTTRAPEPPTAAPEVVTTTSAPQPEPTTPEATTTQAPEAVTDGGFVCPEPNGNFPDALDCQQYYECKDGVATHKVCGPKQLFNSFPSKRKCDRPYIIDFSKCKVNDWWPFVPGKK